MHICNDFFISFCTVSFILIFLHCVKPCIFALFSSTIAFVQCWSLHFWTVAICAVFEGFYSCSFVMFLFFPILHSPFHWTIIYFFCTTSLNVFPLNQVFSDCTFYHQSDRPLYFLQPSHSCWCQEPKLHCFYPPENSVFCTSLASNLTLCFVISASILVFAFIKRLLCSGKQYLIYNQCKYSGTCLYWVWHLLYTVASNTWFQINESIPVFASIECNTVVICLISSGKQDRDWVLAPVHSAAFSRITGVRTIHHLSVRHFCKSVFLKHLRKNTPFSFLSFHNSSFYIIWMHKS